MNLYIMQMMQRRRNIVSETKNDMPPRRRRYRNPEEREMTDAGSENHIPAEIVAGTGGYSADTGALQPDTGGSTPDERVPVRRG